MQDGVYKATFAVGPNWGRGIVTIIGGRVSGGDEGFTYVGTLSGDQQLHAAIDVKCHDASVQNVFAGLSNFHLSGDGQQITPTSARIQATTPAAPGSHVHVELTLLTAF